VARRIRLSRGKGWRKPVSAVVVARPSPWGNPFRVGVDGDRARCVELFRAGLEEGTLGYTAREVQRALAGRDLACWCPLDEPCHADVLLEVANTPTVAPAMGSAPLIVIAVDDPRRDDVRAMLSAHLEFSHAATPPGHVHALDVDALTDPSVTFFSARRAGRAGVLVAIGAIRQLDDTHAELKSMHTSRAERGRGLGRAMLTHLLQHAAQSGCSRVSLETGTMDAFAPARALYASAGFAPCEPFGNYTANPHSVCMTLRLDRRSPTLAP
jgi:putative acetyltransferase